MVALASVAGLAFTGTQIVERIHMLAFPYDALACDVSGTVSCSNVLAAWQSSVVLGIPNAFIGAAMFAVFLSAALAGLLGSKLSVAYLRLVLGLVVFFAAFATWFMWQTAWDIGALCLWCAGIITCIAVIGAAVTTVATRSRLLAFLWGAWWAAVVAVVAIGLWA